MTHRAVFLIVAIAALASLVGPTSLAGQDQPWPSPSKAPPDGFSGIEWGQRVASPIIEEFGQATPGNEGELVWEEAMVLGWPATIKVWIDPAAGLHRGEYAWLFPADGSDVGDLAAAFKCGNILSEVTTGLVGRYGKASIPEEYSFSCYGPKGMEQQGGSQTKWDWWDDGISISVLALWQPSEGGALSVTYRNARLSNRIRADEAERRF